MPTGYTVDEEQKQRIVEAHVKHKVPVSELAQSYNVNRKTIYKWLKEHETSDQPAPEAKRPEQETPSAADEPEDGQEPSSEFEESPNKPEDDYSEDAGAPKDEPDPADEPQAGTNEDSDGDKHQQEAEEVDKADEDCPNPSCNGTFSGDECPKCGFKHSALVMPFKRKQ